MEAPVSPRAQKIGDVLALIQNIATRPIFWPSTPRSRPRTAKPAAALPWSQAKSKTSPPRPRKRPKKSPRRSPASARREKAVDSIKGIDETIARIDEITSAIAAAVEEQDKTTQEITRNTHEVAQGTRDVSTNVGGIKQAVGETGAAASNVLQLAKALGHTADALRGEVEGFLVEIRAA